MDSLEFKPNEEYKKLIEKSDNRKKGLGLDNSYNYKKLGRLELFKKFKYELHHIVPRYRFKNKLEKSLLDKGENVAILTVSEHLLAHYYLTLFESGNYHYSAKMAFIQLFSLKKNSPELSIEEVNELIPHLEKSRSDYFGSEAHRASSRKAGKIAGEIRKLKFETDPEYKKKLLAKIARTPEKRKTDGLRVIENNKNKAPWEINTQTGNGKYTPQYWQYFDSIYTGHVKYGLSYKSIARCIGVPYSRISNIVRIIKSKDNLPINFEDYMFYDSFINKYELTLEKFLTKFEYCSSNNIPWLQNKRSEKNWYFFDVIFLKSIEILKSGNKLKMSDIHPLLASNTVSPKIHAEITKLYNSGVIKLSSIPWINDWEKMKTFYESPPYLLEI